MGILGWADRVGWRLYEISQGVGDYEKKRNEAGFFSRFVLQGFSN